MRRDRALTYQLFYKEGRVRVLTIIVLGLALASVAAAQSGWRSVRSTSMSAWRPAFGCETGYKYDWRIIGYVNHRPTYYGGLQFDHQTWVAHGGLAFANNANLATPEQQVLVASRVTYDGWPNCPEPPRIR